MQLDRQIVVAIIGGIFAIISSLILAYGGSKNNIISSVGNSNLSIESSSASEAVDGKSSSSSSIKVNGHSYSSASVSGKTSATID